MCKDKLVRTRTGLYWAFNTARGIYQVDDFGNSYRVFPQGIMGRGLMGTYIRKGKI